MAAVRPAIRLLGPLELGGKPVEGGPKQRGLLVLLLLHAGAVLPRDRIVDLLWSGGPPNTAAHAVQVYVSRLRSQLGADAIRAEAGGYRLHVDPDEIDTRVFERLAKQGSRKLSQDDPAAAAAVLRQALELWRGPALADVRYESFAQPEIARLEELRLVATEDRIQADLMLGRHAELIPELEALVAGEPTRERVRAQLMLALYRAGRQADALAAYRDGARFLREELGLEPGPELRDLEAAILGQDPALAAPPSGRAAVSSLPSPATPLVGREQEVDQLLELLRSDARLVTLTGAGGIGKTRLALKVADELRDELSHEVWFVALGAVMDPALVGTEVARALSISTAGGDPLEAVAAELGSTQALLVLDNLEHLLDGCGAISELLSACPGLKFLTTSRVPLRLYGEHRWPVPALPLDDAVSLFAERARAASRGFELTSANRQDVESVCRRLDGLPLAIELVAARAQQLSVQDMLGALPHALELAVGGPRDMPDRQRTLRTTVQWSYDLLDEVTATVFHRLGCFSGGWDTPSAREICGATPEQNALLADHSLVLREAVPDRFGMLATIRDFAGERLEASGEADEVRRRHAEYFLGVVQRVERELRAGGDQVALLEALDRDHDNLRAAVAWAAANEPALEFALVAELTTFWIVRGHWAEAARLLDSVLERPAPDDAVRAKALVGAGAIARYRGDYEAARKHLRRAADIYAGLEDWPGAVRAFTNLGFTEVALRAHERARSCYEEALAAAERSGSLRDRNISLNCLADLALREGDWRRAEEVSVESLEFARETGDREAVGVSMMNRAQAALGAGRDDAALRLAGAALEAWAPLKDPSHLALCFDVLAYGLAGCEPEAGAVLLGASSRSREEVGAELDDLERLVRDRADAAVREALRDDQLDDASDRGRALSLDDAIAWARGATAEGLSEMGGAGFEPA